MRSAIVAGATLAAACGSFQNEDVVLDTRVIAMTASLPEQVVTVDLTKPVMPTEILAQLAPVEVCALIADPSFDRKVRYSLTACVADGVRCDTSQPTIPLSSGALEDPEITPTEPRLCATVMPDGNLLGILLATLQGDVLRGLGGIDYLVSLKVGGEDVDPKLDLLAGKLVRIAPAIPMDKTANHNPDLDHLELSIDDGDPIPLPFGRCIEQAAPLEVMLGQKVRITPVETATAREDYVVPTLDGAFQKFTESLTYQWLAGAGGFSKGSTGGPRDPVSGKPKALFTDYKTPKAADLKESTLVPFWVVQRDERLGARWYQTCLRVSP